MLKEMALSIDKGRVVYIYAHNGGGFDYKVLINALSVLLNMSNRGALKHRATVVCDNNHDFYQIRFDMIIGMTKYTFIFRDSYKLLRCRAELASKSFAKSSIAKLDFNHDVFQEQRVRIDVLIGE